MSHETDIPEFLQTEPDGFLHFSNSRIGFQHVIREYNDGESPEALCDHFPTLSLAVIHKAIAFYLDNRSEFDCRFAADDQEIRQQVATAHQSPSIAGLRDRFAAMQRREAL
jgi:uncharacterized protein (DUF433 family)